MMGQMRVLEELLTPARDGEPSLRHAAAREMIRRWRERGHTIVLSPAQDLETATYPARGWPQADLRQPVLFVGLRHGEQEAGLLAAPCFDGHLPDCQKGDLVVLVVSPLAPVVPLRFRRGPPPRRAAEWADEVYPDLQASTGTLPVSRVAGLAYPAIWYVQVLQSRYRGRQGVENIFRAQPVHPYELPDRTWWLML